MKGPFELPITAIEQLTNDCVSVSFGVPKELTDTFSFKQGQYLTLEKSINGEKVRRSYSLYSCPLDEKWSVAIKKIPFGKFSTYANDEFAVGETVWVFPPDGNFTVAVDTEQQRNYVAFAAGSGITPITSIIKTHLTQEPKAKFKLFYINQTTASIILKEELEALKNQFLDRFEIFYFLTKEQRSIPFLNGRINEEKLSVIFKSICDINQTDHYFLCGPEAMIQLIDGHLQNLGVNKKQIHFELFGTDTKKTNQKKAEIKKAFKGKSCSVSIIEGGKTINFEIEQGAQNVLDAALNNAADLPFACKGGVCATCKAKLIEGEVDMLLSYGLEDDEVEAGYVLTCQSIPTSDKVVVDFDV